MELASRINKAIDERALEELGTLEQDLVYGDASSKEIIGFLSNRDNAGALPADKVAATSPSTSSLLSMSSSNTGTPLSPPQKGSASLLSSYAQSRRSRISRQVSFVLPLAQCQHLPRHHVCPTHAASSS